LRLTTFIKEFYDDDDDNAAHAASLTCSVDWPVTAQPRRPMAKVLSAQNQRKHRYELYVFHSGLLCGCQSCTCLYDYAGTIINLLYSFCFITSFMVKVNEYSLWYASRLWFGWC